MPYKNASNSYKETRIKTAGQGQLIVMLYDEAVKQLTKACEMLQANQTQKRDPGKIEQVSKAVMKTEEIITELMVSLDFEQGGDIAKNLFSLYTWFNRELLEANISQNANRMLTVRDMLTELRDTWNTISNQSLAEQKRETAGLNIAG